jgi:hypothetical protein
MVLFAAGGKGRRQEEPRTNRERLRALGLIGMLLDASRQSRWTMKTYERAPENFKPCSEWRRRAQDAAGAQPRRGLIFARRARATRPVRIAVGGKDGIPYPVDRPVYEETIEILSRAVDRARIDRSERISALKRLARSRRDRCILRASTGAAVPETADGIPQHRFRACGAACRTFPAPRGRAFRFRAASSRRLVNEIVVVVEQQLGG